MSGRAFEVAREVPWFLVVRDLLDQEGIEAELIVPRRQGVLKGRIEARDCCTVDEGEEPFVGRLSEQRRQLPMKSFPFLFECNAHAVILPCQSPLGNHWQ